MATKRKTLAAKREVDLKALTYLVTVLDCYRINRFVELDSVEKKVKEGKLGKFGGEWKHIRRILYKIGNLPKLSSNVTRLVRIRDRVKLAEVIALYFFTFALGVLVLTYFNVCPKWLESTFSVVYLPSIGMMLGIRLLDAFIDRKIALEIDKLDREHPQKFRFDRLYLKKTAQNLIDYIISHLKNSHEDPAKYKIDLYNTDYERIEILKSPGTFRKHYTVICKL